MVNRRHGLSGHPCYIVWTGIKQRCLNPKAANYIDYGARGVKMQESWQSDPVDFINYVTRLPNYADRVEKHLTLDRIDNSGNYEEGNLRWADSLTQWQNSRWPHEKRADRERIIAENPELAPMSAKDRAKRQFGIK